MSAEYAAAVMLSFNSIWSINLSNICSESYKAELSRDRVAYSKSLASYLKYLNGAVDPRWKKNKTNAMNSFRSSEQNPATFSLQQ